MNVFFLSLYLDCIVWHEDPVYFLSYHPSHLYCLVFAAAVSIGSLEESGKCAVQRVNDVESSCHVPMASESSHHEFAP